MAQMIQAYAVITEEDDILLQQTTDGYSLIGGQIEPGKAALSFIVDKVKDKVGVDIPLSELILMHVQHDKNKNDESIVLFFHADISEIDEQSDDQEDETLEFFDIDDLPSDIIPSHNQAIEGIKNTILYSEHGW